jgi:hypothetical protein
LRELPEPRPHADEILVRVRAVGVNPVDWKVRQGQLRFFEGFDEGRDLFCAHGEALCRPSRNAYRAETLTKDQPVLPALEPDRRCRDRSSTSGGPCRQRRISKNTFSLRLSSATLSLGWRTHGSFRPRGAARTDLL